MRIGNLLLAEEHTNNEYQYVLSFSAHAVYVVLLFHTSATRQACSVAHYESSVTTNRIRAKG